MSRILFIVAAAIALSGVLAAAFVPVDTLGDREAFFARLIMVGPATLVAVIVFALAAVVHKLTRLEVQGEEMLDRLYAAFPGDAAPRPAGMTAAPAAVPEAAPTVPPPPEPVMAPPPVVTTPAPTVTPVTVPQPIVPPPVVEALPPTPPEPPATPAPLAAEAPPAREPVLPPLAAVTPSETADETPPARQRGFRFGRFSFGRNKAATAAGAAAGAAAVEAAPEPPVMPPREEPPLFEATPPQPFRSEPAPLPPLEADLEAALSAQTSDRPAPPPQEDDLAARLSAALMAANAASEPARPIEPDWPDLAPPTRDDQVTRIGADALSEALLGVGPDEPNLAVATPIEPMLPPLDVAPRPAPEPAPEAPPEPPVIVVADAPAPLPVPEPAPEPMPAPVPETAPLASVMPPAPVADAAPPADAPPRAPTVAEYMARAPEAEAEAPLPKIVREGQFAGRQYRMFEDGSLEIFTEQSTLRFGSLEEFRSFVASGGRRPEGAA